MEFSPRILSFPLEFHGNGLTYFWSGESDLGLNGNHIFYNYSTISPKYFKMYESWMKNGIPWHRDNLEVSAISFHLGNFLIINTSFNIVAEVTNEKHFLLWVPKERVFICTLGLLHGILFCKQEMVIKIFEERVLFLFTIFLFLELQQIEFFSFVSHLMNDLD